MNFEKPFETRSFERYVAIGDSQTEGLHDYHEDGRLRGWADRFAERLAATNSDLLYANLAVRGKRTAAVREEQLEAALALEPDLVTVVSGVNDVVRRSVDLAQVGRELEAMYEALRADGRDVVGCTFPLPEAGLTRRIAPRLAALNTLIRSAAERHGALYVDLEGVGSAVDLRLWSPDRIHLNSLGHERLASAFESALSGGRDERWQAPLPEAAPPSALERVVREASFCVRFVVPKVIRMLRGKSSGDGRTAKRPNLSRVR